MHNHPSRDPTPSQADIAMTRDIACAAAPLGVTIHDHIIIGRGEPASFWAFGLLALKQFGFERAERSAYRRSRSWASGIGSSLPGGDSPLG